jgi:hypothetical protein
LEDQHQLLTQELLKKLPTVYMLEAPCMVSCQAQLRLSSSILGRGAMFFLCGSMEGNFWGGILENVEKWAYWMHLLQPKVGNNFNAF